MRSAECVAVIIPTYNRPAYCEEALRSVLSQTHERLEVFITDNSPGTDTAERLKPYLERDARITYEHHPEYGEQDNWDRGMRFCRDSAAPYINWLMDDDLFAPEKIERMAGVLDAHPEVSLVTSYRLLIDENGCLLPEEEQLPPFYEEDAQFPGIAAGNILLKTDMNFIGEPTTVLIRKKCLLEGYRLGGTGTEGKYFVSDYPTWLRLLSQGDLYYLREPLSYFRQHAAQGQYNLQFLLRSVVCSAIQVQDAVLRKTFLTEPEDIREATLAWLDLARERLDMADRENFTDEYTNQVKRIADYMKESLQRNGDMSFFQIP